MANWLDCIGNCGQINANMDYSDMQGIAVVLAGTACSLGRKLCFDKPTRDIAPC